MASVGGKQVAAPKMSTQVILTKWGLDAYFQYLEKAGYRFLDATLHLTDTEVEYMLSHVEAVCGIVIVPETRVKLWKALRHQWFSGPGHGNAYVGKSEVPKIFLPKPEYKTVDSIIPFGDLESDRQRQIARKVRRVASSMPRRGPLLETMQFEVYKRQPDIRYIYKDIQRCVAEWQKRNPRAMVRDDPREEVMKMRVNALMDTASAQLLIRKKQVRNKNMLVIVLSASRTFFAIMSIVMFYVSYYRYRDSPKKLIFEFATSSAQFRAGTVYLVGFWFLHSCVSRAHADPRVSMLRRLLIQLQRLLMQISDFRVESDELRAVDTDTKSKQVSYESQERKMVMKKIMSLTTPHERKLAKKKHKKKEKMEMEDASQGVDPALAMWAPVDAKSKAPLDVQALQRALQYSYKYLPELPERFRRTEDRLEQKRPGGIPNQDELYRVRADGNSREVQLGLALPPQPVSQQMAELLPIGVGGDRGTSAQGARRNRTTSFDLEPGKGMREDESASRGASRSRRTSFDLGDRENLLRLPSGADAAAAPREASPLRRGQVFMVRPPGGGAVSSEGQALPSNAPAGLSSLRPAAASPPAITATVPVSSGDGPRSAGDAAASFCDGSGEPPVPREDPPERLADNVVLPGALPQ